MDPVTVSECGSHAVVDAEIGAIGGKGSGEQALARRLYARLEPDWQTLQGWLPSAVGAGE